MCLRVNYMKSKWTVQAVCPNLMKFFPGGNFSSSIWPNFEHTLGFGKILNKLWHNFCVIGQTFIEILK